MTFSYGNIITVDFPGITGTKLQPAVILSSTTYHSLRPAVIIGLITTQTKNLGKTDYAQSCLLIYYNAIMQIK